MQPHRNAAQLRTLTAQAAHAVWFHRRRIAATIACAVIVAVLAATLPLLLAAALLERHQTRRRRNLLGLIVIAALAFAVAWLWREARRHPLEPRGPWHPCRQCGAPISDRSRARFCCSFCRRLARLQARADNGDSRAASRLSWLSRDDLCDPALEEVPF
jgi:hypothetical protein